MKILLILLIASTAWAGGGSFDDRMMQQQQVLEDAYEKYVPEKIIRPQTTKVREEFVAQASVEEVTSVAEGTDEGRPPEWLMRFIVIMLTMFPAPVIAISIVTGIVGNLILVRVFWIWIDRLIKKIMGKK